MEQSKQEDMIPLTFKINQICCVNADIIESETISEIISEIII